jgi:hypothetical protein
LFGIVRGFVVLGFCSLLINSHLKFLDPQSILSIIPNTGREGTGGGTFRFIRAASSRSEVEGRRDLVGLSSSVSEGSEVSGAGVVESEAECSDRRELSWGISGEIEVCFSGGDEVFIENEVYAERNGDGGDECLANVGDAGVDDPET